MPNEDNLKPFVKGTSGNPEGRPKGSLNRSTIAKKVLGMVLNTPKDIKKAFAEDYPDLPDKISLEEAMTLSVAYKALNEGDYLKYKAIMDSAYGAPKQEIEHSGEIDMTFDVGAISDDDLQTLLSITNKAKNGTSESPGTN